MAFDPLARPQLSFQSNPPDGLTWLGLVFVIACAAEDAGDGMPSGPADASTLLDGGSQPPGSLQDASFSFDGAPGARDAAVIDINVPGQDAGRARDAGVIDIPLPTANVLCGAAPCEVKNGIVCCETWAKESGFSAAKCISQAMCTNSHSGSGATNRAVTSVCDDTADCSGGQVCCYVRIPQSQLIGGGSQPLCDGFLGSCPDTAFIGPGASRVCADLADCNNPSPPSLGTGVISCTSDADCGQVGGSCQPELADPQPKPVGTVASTSGPRPYAKVCR